MTKILKPYTIIPSDLYVQRDADKQLKNIISDMGRPGYVLVSRQMGKTNLLLNAKRNFETQDNVFVYVDLSNSFYDVKSCFENIIDVALESKEDKFNEVSKIIRERRTEMPDTPPHKQHTNELRLILKALNGGKMVIMLDEIDALTKTNYSDQIFSQIRSSYFASRVNYKEFHNLTYLLSGVVEPSEIIRDPKISPFNIGQKIYLNDFSKDEFLRFIDCSKLQLPEELSNHIYSWVNGNPRMTWDICSEIENEIINGSKISKDAIDEIITKLYLTSYDKPPIDNIRELVINDREIRNAIIELDFKKGKVISDRIKSKLYLAGIINYEEKDISIKNEIIKQSLNLDWIQSLEEEEKGLFNIGMEEYNKKNYSNALNSFKKYLESNEFVDISHSYYIMGHCASVIQRYEESLTYYNKCDFNVKEEPIWFYRVLAQKGLLYFNLNKIELSLNSFKEIIENWKKDELFSRSLLNYGSISLKSDKPEHRDAAIEIFQDIIDESAFSEEKINPQILSELKSYAYFNMAQLKAAEGVKMDAVTKYEESWNLANDLIKPCIVLGILNNIDSEEKKFEALNKVIDLIVVKDLSPKDYDPEYPLNYCHEHLRELLVISYLESDKSLYDKLSKGQKLLDDVAIGEHIYNLAVDSFNNNDYSKGIRLINIIHKKYENNELELKDTTVYNNYKLLSYFTKPEDDLNIHTKYIEQFSKNNIEKIDYLDMEIFANLIFYLTGLKKFDKALEYVKILEDIKDKVDESLLINYLVIYHLELNLYIQLKQNQKVFLKAEQILKFSNDKKIKQQNSNLLGDTGLETIRDNAKSVLGQIDQTNNQTKAMSRRERRAQQRQKK